MTLKQFTEFITQYEKFQNDIHKMYKFGINLLEGKFKINDHVYNMFRTTILSHYNKMGLDWVEWWCFENDYGKEHLHAEDADGNKIAYSIESLHKLLEEHRNERH